MKGDRKTKVFKFLLITVFIFVATYIVGYFSSKNSDAFSVAKSFILQSEIIKNELGNINSIELSPFGYELEFAGPSGSAEFECDVVGVAKIGKAYVKLKKQSDIWSVVGAQLTIDNRQISFMQ